LVVAVAVVENRWPETFRASTRNANHLKKWMMSTTTGYSCFHYQRYDAWHNISKQHKNDDGHAQ
jgi:hypothetical protein